MCGYAVSRKYLLERDKRIEESNLVIEIAYKSWGKSLKARRAFILIAPGNAGGKGTSNYLNPVGVQYYKVCELWNPYGVLI